MKSPLKLPREQIEALRPGDVRLYLTGRGWLPRPDGSSSKAVEFYSPAYPEVELLLPLKQEVGDFALRMADVVVGLATVEKRSPWDVLRDLSGPPGDVFKLRVSAQDATLGNIPLDEGIQLLRGGRDLLSAAAYSTLRPQALYPQKMPKEVREFLRTCRLGQTERGSFIATIVTPIPPEIQTSIDFKDEEFRLGLEPYPRRVTTRLMSTLGLVSNAIQSGEPGQIIEAVEDGVSANLCEALKTMKPTGEQSRLDISVSWARNRVHVPKNVPQTVSFPQESFAFIEEATRQLRRLAFAGSKKYEGAILAVQKMRRPLFPDLSGRIVIVADVGGEAAKVRVDLDEADFRSACEAIRDGKKVALAGIIRHDVRTREYELSDPTDFEIID